MTRASDPQPAMTAVVGPVLDRALRTYALALAVMILVMLPLASQAGLGIDTPTAIRWPLGIVLLALNLRVAATSWTEATTKPHGQRWLEAYPLATVCLVAVVTAFVSDAALYPMLMLTSASVGALFCRKKAAVLLATIPSVALFLQIMHLDRADALVSGSFVLATILVVWVTYTTGVGYREALLQHEMARDLAAAHARGLTAVASAARQVQVLEPHRVLQAVADVTADLEWTMCGLYVPAPDGNGHVLGGHRGLPDAVVDQRQPVLGVFGEILRTGKAAAFVDYPNHPDANPHYHMLGTAAGAPILVHGVLRGALVVGRPERTPLNEVDLQLIELLADQAGRALEIAEQYEQQQSTVVELERVNQLKQDFLATVSHELRTPLQVVLGMAETMTMRWDAMPDEMRRDMSARLHTNAAGLEHVIEALLDFSRLESGIVQPRRKDVALVDVANEVVSRLSTITGDHEVSVNTSQEPTNGEAWGDPLLLERVIENLITNACRHTPKGTIVEVRVRREAEATVVEVADNGPGISPEDLQRLGERFYRGGDPMTRPTRGLGLGLAFCSEVLVLHDSELQIQSEPGKGASFQFALPRGRARERQDA